MEGTSNAEGGKQCLRALVTGCENEAFKLRLVAQRDEVLVVLRAHAQGRLDAERTLQSLEREFYRTEPRTRRRQRVMNVGGFGVAFERAFEQLLRGNVFAAIEFDDATIIQSFGVARQRTLRTEAGFSDGEIGARPRRDLGDSAMLVDERAKQHPRFRETTACKLFMRTLESF